MNIAYKFRIYPNTEQKVIIGKTFGCVRFIYNKMLGDKIKHYEETKKKLNNTPAQYKSEFEWLKEVDSLALANAQINLQTAYNNFFRDPKMGFPKFKSKKNNHKSYTTNIVGNNIRIENGHIILPKVKAVKIKQHRDIPDNYKLKSVTVSQTPSGKYYASILFEYEKEIKEAKINNIVGLDFSMKELYVSSDKEFGQYPKFYRNTQSNLAKEQRKLSRCIKGSNRYYKQKYKVALIHEKVANQRKDFLHKASRKITNYYDAVCVENLNMKAMSQSLNFGKSVADNGWGIFLEYMKYKLKDVGKKLIKIDKWFPSSKTCSCCGAVKQSLSLSDRVYVCDCGSILDRDINAAINIKNEGIKILGTI